MKEYYYDEYFFIEQSHWWFTARRRILARLIKKYSAGRNEKRILDLGTGTGVMLQQSSGADLTVGLDREARAIKFCRERGIRNLVRGNVEYLPIKDGAFDLIFCLDLLEHIGNDRRALEEIFRVCRKGGFILITVPAFQFLWGEQDEINEHVRRYTAKELTAKIGSSDLIAIRKITYFNSFLFPPIAGFRMLRKIFKPEKKKGKLRSDFSLTGAGKINTLLQFIFGLEQWPLLYINFPFGVSLCCIAQKR